jgi:ADP-L-glycero-D-manno-heptose 6-epimerase
VYLVTGGAGFIGSHLLRGLNAVGIYDVMVVDDLQRPVKAANLDGCRFEDLIDKVSFRNLLRSRKLPRLDAVWHLGACTDTTCNDIAYLNDNNVGFSIELLDAALSNRVPFVYASSSAVYGSRSDRPEPIGALNPYAASKLSFDEYVGTTINGVASTLVGFRYFNTYGPGERHKGHMASMVYQIFRQLMADGVARLYEGTGGFDAGEQRRDFVHISDVVRLNLSAVNGGVRRGVVDVGTGRSRSFNEVVAAFAARLGFGAATYVPIDPAIKNRYQSYSQADLTGLRALNLPIPQVSLEDGIAMSISAWLAEH